MRHFFRRDTTRNGLGLRQQAVDFEQESLAPVSFEALPVYRLFGPFRPVLYRCGHELGTSIPPHIGSAINLRADLSPTWHVDRHSMELVVHRRPLWTSLARWQRTRLGVHLPSG